jgi:hypothetical protein
MKLQSKLIAAGLGAFVLLASPAVQANPSVNAVTNATNSAVQSAVRNARDDAARRIAQREHKSTTRTR